MTSRRLGAGASPRVGAAVIACFTFCAATVLATEAHFTPLNGSLWYDATQMPAAGAWFDQAFDATYSHEPNLPADEFPGTTFGNEPTGPSIPFRAGFHNTYVGYAEAPRTFADLQARRVVNPLAPDGLFGSIPLQPLAGASGTYHHGDRALQPGAYTFSARMGLWHDKTHEVTEHLSWSHSLDPFVSPETTSYAVAPDGWIGNIVKTTGFWRLAGWSPVDCTVHAVAATYEFAQCNPYKDGWGWEPNNYLESEGEFLQRCGVSSEYDFPTLSLWIEPLGPMWPEDAIVIRDYRGALSHPLSWWSGASLKVGLPVELALECDDGLVESRDLLVLPKGNIDIVIRTTFVVEGSVERLVDVDDYGPWGAES